MEQIINYWKTDNQLIVHDADFYGPFHANHSMFKFSMGETILIREAAEYVKKTIEQEGLKSFSSKKCGAKKPKVSFEGTFHIHNTGRFFTNIETTRNTEKVDTDELKIELHQKVLNLLKSNGVGDEKLDSFGVDKVLIDTRSKTVTGVIPCIICGTSKTFRINTKSIDGKFYWTTSNFQTHLTDKHKTKKDKQTQRIVAKTNKEPKKEAKNSDSKTVSTPNDDSKVDEKSVPNDSQMCNINPECDKLIKSEPAELDASDNNDFKSSSCIELSIDPVHIDYVTIEVLDANIYEQISKQSLKMIEMSLRNNDNVQTMDFKHMDKTYYLDIATIPPDGNCLVGAMVHQIFGYKILSEEHILAVAKLRADVVNFISDNMKLF